MDAVSFTIIRVMMVKTELNGKVYDSNSLIKIKVIDENDNISYFVKMFLDLIEKYIINKKTKLIMIIYQYEKTDDN